MPIIRDAADRDLIKLTEVQKDDEKEPYIILTHIRGGLTWSHAAMQELIEQLQRTMRHITDAELREGERHWLLDNHPDQYRHMYGDQDALWQQWIATHAKQVSPKATPPAKLPRTGFVYVIQCGESFKIGLTNNPTKRLRVLSVKAPFPLTVHLLIPTNNMEALEGELHTFFAHKHRRGEWFDLTEEDIEILRQKYITVDHSGIKAQ
jgi:hypothetical protein